MTDTYAPDRDHRMAALLYAADLIRMDGFTPETVSTSDTRQDITSAIRQAALRYDNPAAARSDLHFLTAGRKATEGHSADSWFMFTCSWSEMDAVDWLTDLADLVADGMEQQQQPAWFEQP